MKGASSKTSTKISLAEKQLSVVAEKLLAQEQLRLQKIAKSSVLNEALSPEESDLVSIRHQSRRDLLGRHSRRSRSRAVPHSTKQRQRKSRCTGREAQHNVLLTLFTNYLARFDEHKQIT